MRLQGIVQLLQHGGDRRGIEFLAARRRRFGPRHPLQGGMADHGVMTNRVGSERGVQHDGLPSGVRLGEGLIVAGTVQPTINGACRRATLCERRVSVR
ncbi:MAG TPA: hypothetical protein VLJ62_13740 [Burkholderiaceae bacterium]|nr:hypothetical protein [Burkholderiaceae bacterium]